MNILMINQPLNNRGDESAHKALVRNLLAKIPTVSIRIIFLNSSISSINAFKVEDDRVNYIRIGLRKPGKIFGRLWQFSQKELNKGGSWVWNFDPMMSTIIKHFKWCDWVINAPGGICLGGFQNWQHLNLLRIGKLLHKPIAYYGRSFGPFPTVTPKNKEFQIYSQDVLSYFSFLSIRDKETEKLARSMNLNYVSTVDAAFLESPCVELPNKVKSLLNSSPYIVFVPNILIWHYAYEGKISVSEIVEFYSSMAKIILKTKKCNIVMLPQTFLFGNYQNDDIHLFHDIAYHLNDKRVIIIPDTYNSDVQQTIISNSQLVIGARYHSIVFAINNNIPFIALSYEHKIEGLLQTLGKKDCMIDITMDILTFNGREEILKTVKNMIDSCRNDTTATVKAKEISKRCFQLLVEKLKDN